ncbi:hypothetical protein TNCV_1278141 [Trichonephila clavipes]|nr:hypothetical protein TNCV_1278141 [Trichonephila clavipes]
MTMLRLDDVGRSGSLKATSSTSERHPLTENHNRVVKKWDCQAPAGPVLVVISRPMTAQQYLFDILRQVVLLFFLRLTGLTFQHDNTSSNTTRVIMLCLQVFHEFPLPSRSLDLSPIENILNVIGR